MKEFWTCGPFKKANDDLERTIFRAEQMHVFMETLEEAKKIDDLIETGTTEEKLLASLMKLDIDKKIETLIGVPDGNEEENAEISGETILESSKDSQKNKLETILERLKEVNFLDEETLRDVVQSLQDDEGWSLARVLAHLDLIDIDERT